jgi:hypothetical protein
MNEKIKSAVIGGLLLGFLSAIPFVNFVNLCCCAWVLFGGALAVKLYIGKSPTPVTVGEGAGIGAIAGLIGAVVYLFIGVPLSLLTGNAFAAMFYSLFARISPEAGEQMRIAMERQMSMGIVERLISAIPGALIGFVVIVIFATIGGLIAVPIFEKRKGGMSSPPPPPGFGGPQGGYPPPQNYGQPGGGYGA